LSVLLDRDGGIVTVTIDRPEAMNALDRPTLEELCDRLRELAEDAEARVVELLGLRSLLPRKPSTLFSTTR
jgi:enoyl-CoA hydratase/carnithine racemase